jgi:hypothetical protein
LPSPLLLGVLQREPYAVCCRRLLSLLVSSFQLAAASTFAHRSTLDFCFAWGWCRSVLRRRTQGLRLERYLATSACNERYGDSDRCMRSRPAFRSVVLRKRCCCEAPSHQTCKFRYDSAITKPALATCGMNAVPRKQHSYVLSPSSARRPTLAVRETPRLLQALARVRAGSLTGPSQAAASLPPSS